MISGAQKLKSQSGSDLLTFNKLPISLYFSPKYEVLDFLANCFEISCWKDKYVVIMKTFKQHFNKDFQPKPQLIWAVYLFFNQAAMNYFEVAGNKTHFERYFSIKLEMKPPK